MNTQELFEAAQLDALGLLDEREQAEFEAAFAGASPAIRAQLRDEQARFAKPDRFRLSAEPPVELRARVLGAIKAEIAEVAGSARSRLHLAGRELPTVHPVRRVSSAWRVATLACATAAVVLAILVQQQNAQMQRLANVNMSDATLNELLGVVGPSDLTDVLLSASSKKVPFTAAQPDFKGEASVFYNPSKQTARLLCRNIVTQPGETVRLVVLDEDGRVASQIAEFDSQGEIISKSVSMSGYNPKQLALYVTARGVDAAKGHLAMITTNI
ncbi:MAG: hypothetical protein JNM86_15675 [Phycisphaerae bacterium]|nr:hypothetical protein [Phycisphaerae bacterium]MBN8596226.1 hypothetical protein [Planctomycetota bacterium]